MNSVRQRFVAEALSWLGTRYHHGAMVKGDAKQHGGVDCIMLMVAAGRAAGKVSPDFDPRPYPQYWYMHRDEEKYLNGIIGYCTRTESPQRGDIVLYKFGRTVSHGAIYLDETQILHAYAENPMRCVCISDSRDLASRFHSYWSID